MDLKKYFEQTKGMGVLATADAEGRTDAAVYARPHVYDDGTVAFLMRERTTYANIGENGHATYLFAERGEGYRGVRLHLKKKAEEEDPELIGRMTRSSLTPEEDREKGPKHLIRFEVTKVRPLVGEGEL